MCQRGKPVGDSDRKELAEALGQAEIAVDSQTRPELEDFFWQVPKVLQGKRWEAREGPFRGFNSPPGKF